MKHLLTAVVLASICMGCSEEKKFEIYPITPEIRTAINDRVSSAMNDIAKCGELAKCMGYKSGELIQSGRWIIGEFPNNTYQVTGDFKCVLTTSKMVRYASGIVNGQMQYREYPEVREISLSEVQPMYEGCTNKKCDEKECKR